MMPRGVPEEEDGDDDDDDDDDDDCLETFRMPQSGAFCAVTKLRVTKIVVESWKTAKNFIFDG